MTAWNPWNAQSRFLLENSGGRLTQPGSWFLDGAGDLSYRPRPDERMGKADFIAPVSEKLVTLRGAANVHFKGLRFGFAGYQMPADGCPPVQAAAKIGAAQRWPVKNIVAPVLPTSIGWPGGWCAGVKPCATLSASALQCAAEK